MVLPLILIPLIILAMFVILLIPAIVNVIKITLLIVAIIFIVRLLKKRFGKAKELVNWEFVVIIIGIFAGILTIGTYFGFLSVASMPMAVQQPLTQISLSPIALFLGFIIVVLTLIIIFKKR